ncbi:putative NIT2-nitrilase [Mucor mucedo]|uniref:putative NIT2-nitrilase n=1 Tax=Mucor mucedo TaxID=29922 RepID=UPI00221E9C05|nr:putative NIT2-nitrilase [Mucor mucedo]KAI7896072.1 putative NIT2-nitrilase [Mucor mucedo]
MSLLAAVGQFCATCIVSFNKTTCQDLVRQASQRGAKMIFLPEASDFVSKDKEQTLDLTRPLNDSEFLKGLVETAQEHKIWVSVGVHESSNVSDKVYNTHVVLNHQGRIVSTYRKLHLFNVDIEGGPRLMESDGTLQGDQLPDLIQTPLGKLGLETCYDMRFPELSLALRTKGAQLLAFPSAFTIKTGMAHWEVLLRARAIETQSYVFAAAQIGQHNEKRASYGNSMIVDPWGTVLARCPDTTEPSVVMANVDLDYLTKIRTEMPVMQHRRNDIYPGFVC